MRPIFLFIFLTTTFIGFTQNSYVDSVRNFQKEYVATHEVVKGADKNRLRFFEIDSSYRVVATLEKKENSQWFAMQTSGPMKKLYRVYGVLHFTINHTPLQLNVYQSQSLLQSAEYRTYLFLPFTDATTGNETYHGGRYIDLKMEDIQNNQVVIDFNKAYNPYCAYVSGKYNCPIPPAENHLSIAVRAGEKIYSNE